MARVIDRFIGEYQFLSNFYFSMVEFDSTSFPSVEHAFQAAKTHDPKERERILNTPSPGQAKRLGRRVTLRPDWDQVKIGIMRELLRRKFRHPCLRAKLLATKDAELTEGNHWDDTFWGVCRGSGQNHLGRLLMEVREELT